MSRKDRLLLTSHAAATWFMTGVIWFVQIVHYPLFKWIGSDAFSAYERDNIVRTAAVVVPVMLLEAFCAVMLLRRRSDSVDRGSAAVGAGLLAMIWASSLFLQFPMHTILTNGFDPAITVQLTSTNWIRTLLWSARSLLAARMISGRAHD